MDTIPITTIICHRNGIVWKAVPHCLMWCIWKEWNSRSFEDMEQNLPDLNLPLNFIRLDVSYGLFFFRFIL